MKRNNCTTALDCPLPKQVIYHHPSAFDRASEQKRAILPRRLESFSDFLVLASCFFLLVIPLLVDLWSTTLCLLFSLWIGYSRDCALIIMKQLQIKFALPETQKNWFFDIIKMVLCYCLQIAFNLCSNCVAIAQNQSD